MIEGPGFDAEDRWNALTRTAAAVRVPRQQAARRGSRRLTARVLYIAALGCFAGAGLHAIAAAPTVHADGGADADLFSLTNQDRASNGVRALAFNGTLQTIGEGGRYNGCGFAVSGRSVDMIQRNYFAHPILNCGGRNVFAMMQAYGVGFRSAGENIGWNTYGGGAAAAAQINVAFMNSPDHRSNILNGAYTDLGIGSANSGGSAWSGGGGSHTGVWMFSEEFAQLHGAPAPRPPPPPPAPRPPAPKPRPPVPGNPVRNSAAPAAPAQPPAAVAQPAKPVPAATAAPTAPPTATPTPAPTPVPTLVLPPLVEEPGGLLFNSVESVLENYLIS